MPSENSTHRIEEAATGEAGLPVAPSLGPALEFVHVPIQLSRVGLRSVFLCGLAGLLAVAAGLVAQVLIRLIALVTHVSFYGRLSIATPASPWQNNLGVWVIGVPVIGALIVGLMARYGSRAIRGHGIPEAMEQVLLNESRIPPRITFLKPISAAIAIGTGGPFGAEGPIIATGGALGSLVGQLVRTTADERKTLLACGAAAGMAATFGSPVSAVLLAVELLLFEFRPRSLIPVAFASAVAAGVRLLFEGSEPVFAMPTLLTPTSGALAIYLVIGALLGVAAVAVTRAVYAVEDAFEHLPIHWMWWPCVGAVAVGVIGYFCPRTLGVGYANISDILSLNLSMKFVAILCVAKFVSWAIYLGSGTSGGTLAPLFTIGGALGAMLGVAASRLMPGAHVSISIAALVGMAAIFAGSARAMLASVVFAFETTLQPLGLLPLLAGCSASFLVSSLLMRNTIMTEKIARRGVRVPTDYAPDFLEQVLVREMMSRTVVTLLATDSLQKVRAWLATESAAATHQGFPVLDGGGSLQGVVTRRHLTDARNSDSQTVGSLIGRPPTVVYEDVSLRAAANHMVNHDIGRLPVMSRAEPGKLVGILTRSDILKAR